MRESPALDVSSCCSGAAPSLSYTDPYVPVLAARRPVDLTSIAASAAGDGVDCAVICTDHRRVRLRGDRSGATRWSSTRATR